MSSETVHDKDSFIDFLSAMPSELDAESDDWVGVDLDSFLEAMAAPQQYRVESGRS